MLRSFTSTVYPATHMLLIFIIMFQSTSEIDGPIKSKEVQQAEKIYTTLRECREQVGLNKMKGKKI